MALAAPRHRWSDAIQKLRRPDGENPPPTFEVASRMGSHNWSAILEGQGEPTRVWFNGVSATYFDVLGVRPFLGRAFTPEDGQS